MTKEQVIEKVNKLINESADCMKKNVDRVLNNGSVDIENYEDNFLLPKIILQALLKEESFQYKLEGKDKKVSDNIYNCL